VALALKIHRTQETGHILVFLTGQDEIDRACNELEGMITAQIGDDDSLRSLQVLPLYGLLGSDDQTKAFNIVRQGVRKCIFATNIAETSVTIPGVRYVIDSGYCKQKAYDPSRGLESLVIVPTSKVSANQRAGRAGRTDSGQCFRLYSKVAFDEMMDETVPEIQRTNLGSTVLYLKCLGVADVLGFDFYESPGVDGLTEALHSLHSLGALDDRGLVTARGRSMSRLPLDPRMSRTILQAGIEQCLEEVIVIASIISSEVIWCQRPRRRGGDDGFNDVNSDLVRAHSQFLHPKGDHFTYLETWKQWERAQFNETWIRDNFLRVQALRTAKLTHRQLRQEVEKLGLPIASCGAETDPIARSFMSGYLDNVARRCSEGVYTLLPKVSSQVPKDAPSAMFVYVQPSSSLSQLSESPSHVLFHELVCTAKPFMRGVLALDDVAWMLTCRKVTTVSANALCGLSEPKTHSIPAVPSVLSSIATPSETSSKRDSSDVDSARERFLARKKSKQ
jgi:HrpA-like RNA helicase